MMMFTMFIFRAFWCPVEVILSIMIMFRTLVAFTMAAEVIVILVRIREVDFWQDMHQRDIGQGADGDEEREARPPVERLQSFRVINRCF